MICYYILPLCKRTAPVVEQTNEAPIKTTQNKNRFTWLSSGIFKVLKKGIFDYLEETGQTHTQNKFIASLKKVFNQIETKGIE